MSEMINHPSHYNKPGRQECIVEMFEKFGATAVYWFSVLSAYKYRYRAGDKPDNAVEQEVAKAEWYDHMAEEMRRLHAPDGWVSKKEGMPEDGQQCLIYRKISGDLKLTTGVWNHDRKLFLGLRHGTAWDDVIKWKALPEVSEE